MSEFVTLTCPSCGAKLNIGKNIDVFACDHCGNEHRVIRDGGIISLAPVVEQLLNVRNGVDKTASELAINRLKQEIDDLNSERKNLEGPGCVSSIYSNGCGGFITLVVIGVILAVIFGAGDEGTGIVFGVVIAVTIIAIIIDYSSKKELVNKQNNIDKIIAEKRAELAHHERTVKMN